jgi:ferredoxin
MVPFRYENMMTVACSNKETGKSTRSMCKVGCIGCGLCVKQTEQFKVEDNLAHLDYKKYEANEQTETAMNKCPTKVIIYRGKTAPKPLQPGQKTVTSTKA